MAMITFIAIASYKLLDTTDTSSTVETLARIDLSMIPIFITMFGVVLAIIAFYSYSSIKEHAMLKAEEITKKMLGIHKKKVSDLLENHEKKFQTLHQNLLEDRNEYSKMVKGLQGDINTSKLEIIEESMKNE
ncbi:MAG: hypothetical protein LBQ34_01590 [Alphaproteobacteria bacterium]|jgi:hypothetical protein|nr:hypothetical protein [Alphaproteobacteria bacterium]